MPFVNTGNKTELYYEETNPGGKIPVLFCHGSGGTSYHWRFQKNLPENLRLMAVDLPGHGRSGGEPSDTVEGYREVIKTVADKLNITPFYMAGHSLGGAITLDYARCYPADLQGIILISTGARLKVLPSILETFQKEEVFPEMPYFSYGQNADRSLIEEGRRELSETPPGVFYKDFTACNRFDLMAELSGIKVPALVIAGTEDRLTPIKYSFYLKDNLPDAEMAAIEEAGHMVMLEKPDEVNKNIAAFCR